MINYLARLGYFVWRGLHYSNRVLAGALRIHMRALIKH